ncbi:thiosulfate transmembrane transporter [Aureococcus anophagefferens]|nr:thiosulfate transmembrane transporter [Aureococcus anophagefferens]
MPRRRVRQARMSRAALLLAASAAAQAPVNVTVVALALPAYGEATTRVWRALGVEGLHVGCGPALRSGALNSDLASPVAAAGVDAAFVGVDGLAGGRRYFLRHDATEPFPLPDGAVDYVYAEHFIEHVPRPDLAAYAASYLGDGSFLAARHRLNGDLFDLPPGAATLNNIFTAYGHGRGYLYDYAEFLGLLDEADLGCAPERAAFRESRRIPDVAAAFDGLSRAHESFYVDVVCPPR